MKRRLHNTILRSITVLADVCHSKTAIRGSNGD